MFDPRRLAQAAPRSNERRKRARKAKVRTRLTRMRVVDFTRPPALSACGRDYTGPTWDCPDSEWRDSGRRSARGDQPRLARGAQERFAVGGILEQAGDPGRRRAVHAPDQQRERQERLPRLEVAVP